MEKKLRIQKYDIEGRLVDDRMVSQDPEFISGPKLAHDGPLRIEFSLLSKDDIEKAKLYLDKLTGILPLDVKSIKKIAKSPILPEHREQLLDHIISVTEDQDQLIDGLRKEGFKFMMTDFLETFDYPLNIKSVHKEKYQWMLKCTKLAKNPVADKYDPMLAFGIKLNGDKTDKVVVYLNGEFNKSYKIPWPSKSKETFKKTDMMKFPHYMIPEERDKFRFEIRQYQNNPDKTYSKFFLRWVQYVENVPKLSQPY